MSKANSAVTQREDMPKRVDAVYRDASQNLVFLKKQQVTVTNYAILAYAAVITVKWRFESQHDPLPFLTQFLLLGAAIIGLAVSAYFLWELEGSMTKYRERLAWIYRGHFSCDECDALKLPRAAGRSQGIFLGLLAISVAGFAIAVDVLSH